MLRVWFVAVLGLLATALVPVGSGTAAVTSYLCWGYDGCQKAGYSHANYKQNSGKMWWRMYGGHNCTNYVAYRIIKNGYSTERPWTGSGNATNWGVAMKNITDTTPTVGSVAWWRAGQGGVGSAGHVAYVERVVSKNEIVVSQDSWGGDFSWRRITKSGGRWPTGFIHFNDRALESKKAPVVNGDAQVGQKVKMAGATWKGKPDTKTRQWYADGKAIPGATKRAFQVTKAEIGKKLTAKVTAARKGWSSAVASTPATDPVVKGEYRPVDEPVLQGDPRAGETLTVDTDVWTPDPAKMVVRWFADGKRLQGVEGEELALGDEHLDAKIRARVVVNGPGFTRAVQDTAETEPVYRDAAELKAPTRIKGRPIVGRTLTAKPGAVTPSNATVTHRWLRDGREVGKGEQYVVQAGDLGKQLTVETTATADGYKAATSQNTREQAVTTKPVIKYRAVGKKRVAAVKVRVRAPGMSTVNGQVRIRVGKQRVVAKLVDSLARVRVEGLAKGTRKVRIKYLRTDLARPAWAKDKVVIK